MKLLKKLMIVSFGMSVFTITNLILLNSLNSKIFTDQQTTLAIGNSVTKKKAENNLNDSTNAKIKDSSNKITNDFIKEKDINNEIILKINNINTKNRIEEILRKPEDDNEINSLKKSIEDLKEIIIDLQKDDIRQIKTETFDKISEKIKDIYSKVKELSSLKQEINIYLENVSLNEVDNKIENLIKIINNIYNDKTLKDSLKYDNIIKNIADNLKILDLTLDKYYKLLTEIIYQKIYKNIEKEAKEINMQQMKNCFIDDNNKPIDTYITVFKTKNNDKLDDVSFSLLINDKKLEGLGKFKLEVLDMNNDIVYSEDIKQLKIMNSKTTMLVSAKTIDNDSFKQDEIYKLNVVGYNNGERYVIFSKKLKAHFEEVSENTTEYNMIINGIVNTILDNISKNFKNISVADIDLSHYKYYNNDMY